MPVTRWTIAILSALIMAVAPEARAQGMWITHPAAHGADAAGKPIALQFRRSFNLPAKPRQLWVQVSADNRFVLFVNGARVAAGPARGDLNHWRFERIDIGQQLRAGTNIITAQVWSDGDHAPVAQIFARTAFLLSSAQYPALDSGRDWDVRIDGSRTSSPAKAQIAQLDPTFYYVAGAPETLSGAQMLKDWPMSGASARDWQGAAPAIQPSEKTPWTLVPDALPQMRHERANGGTIVRSEGMDVRTMPVTIAAHKTVRLLIDAGRVQAAYPRLTVDGGAGAHISLTYAEGLYGADRKRLPDRAQVKGGQALGLSDLFLPDGARRVFEPYWWRTWRFVEIAVTTDDAPIRIEGFDRMETGYPFETKGWFRSDDAELDRIWSIGWDTVKIDAHESFMDTAYWEQLQYAGDTRLEALISYAVSGDARLAIQAIDAFASSRVNGLPPSRYPSREDQSIPPFALLWIGMVHDFWMNRPEIDVVRRSLPTAQAIMRWYDRYVGSDGLVGTVPGWQFIDWRPSLANGPEVTDPPPDPDSCIMSLFYIGAAQQLAQMQAATGATSEAGTNRAAAARMAGAVRARCWSPEKGLFTDAPGGRQFSQHANILAVLYDVAPVESRSAILQSISTADGIVPPAGVEGTTYYFSYYLVRALDHAGLAHHYWNMVKSWRSLLRQNFTSWPENPDPSRSDTHAWSAHPTVDLLRIVAGIGSAEPGFRSVRITPNLGHLKHLDAAMAHADGLIRTVYTRDGDDLGVRITLPKGMTGRFQLGDDVRGLYAGENRFSVQKYYLQH